jgi:RNA polymerase sigma-70 factor, ECF subfamily
MARDSKAGWEKFRSYLGLLARLDLDPKLEGKVDVSGVVQQTMLEAVQAREVPSGDEERIRWLRRVLANNLRDEIRKFRTQTRDIEREQSLEASSLRIDRWLASQQSSPSHIAMRHERSLHLAEALAKIPEDQRRAIELHHLQSLKLAETAELLGRSKGAVAQLLFRGLTRLRHLMGEQEP